MCLRRASNSGGSAKPSEASPAPSSSDEDFGAEAEDEYTVGGDEDFGGREPRIQVWVARMPSQEDEEKFALELRWRTLTLHFGLLITVMSVEAGIRLRGEGPTASSFYDCLATSAGVVVVCLAMLLVRDEGLRGAFTRQGHRFLASFVSVVHSARVAKLLSVSGKDFAHEAARMRVMMTRRHYWSALSLLEATQRKPEIMDTYLVEVLVQCWISFTFPMLSASAAFQAAFHMWNAMSTAVIARLVGDDLDWMTITAPFVVSLVANLAGNALVHGFLMPIWMRARADLQIRVVQLSDEKERLVWEQEIAAAGWQYMQGLSGALSESSESRSASRAPPPTTSSRPRASRRGSGSAVSMTTSCVRSLVDNPLETYDTAGGNATVMSVPSPAAQLVGDEGTKLWRHYVAGQFRRIRLAASGRARRESPPPPAAAE